MKQVRAHEEMKRLTPTWEQKWGGSQGKPSDNSTGLTQSEREKRGRKGGWKHLTQGPVASLSQSCSSEEPQVSWEWTCRSIPALLYHWLGAACAKGGLGADVQRDF